MTDHTDNDISVSEGARRIAAERARQMTKKGYTAKHDDNHGAALAWAAACYAAPEPVFRQHRGAKEVSFCDPWPWEPHYDRRPHDGNVLIPSTDTPARIRRLEKAGALVAAEIDRLLRVMASRGDQKP